MVGSVKVEGKSSVRLIGACASAVQISAMDLVDGVAPDGSSKTAAAIELQLDTRVGQLVPVDRQARPAEIGSAGQPHAASAAFPSP